MTARTTAHLVAEIDDRYFDLIEAVGEEDAKLYYESQVAAINRIEAVCHDEGIDADFARLPGYLIGASEQDQAELDREYDACRKLGVDLDRLRRQRAREQEGQRQHEFRCDGSFHDLVRLLDVSLAFWIEREFLFR